MKVYIASLFMSLFLIVGLTKVNGQISNYWQLDGRQNVITTAVPFLAITPDSRAGGLADAGVALPPDANSIHWNPAKLAFVDHQFGFGLSYTPWLRNLVPDINLSYLSMYYKIDNLQTFGASMRYFSLGDIQFTDNFGDNIGSFRPYEFALDGAYSRKLSDYFSVGLALRFIYSDLAGNIPLQGGGETKPGTSIAGDISAYYQKDINAFGYNAKLALGGDISNIGAKITYTDKTQRDFIPTYLRLGGYLNLKLDEYNELAFTADLSKLLVPTPPQPVLDSLGRPETNPDGTIKIAKGMNPNQPAIQGMIQSFYDAPGGFKEEIQEIDPSIGVEYWYAHQFAVRAGYFYESPKKGNRQYITVGAGLRYNVFGFDAAYLIPTNSKPGQQSPLENTVRFTMLFHFDKAKEKKG